MRVRVERDVLAEAVAWTSRSLPARSSLPLLAGIVINAGDLGSAVLPDGSSASADEVLTLSGGDLETSARASITAVVDEPGSILVSGRLLSDIARALPARPVQLVSEGSRLVVTCGSARFSLASMPVEDYPAFPAIPAAVGHVPGREFAEAVSQVVVAAGRDDVLPALTGARLEITTDGLVLVATDRYRLALRTLDWSPVPSGTQTGALIGAKTLSDVAKSLAGVDQIAICLSAPGSGLAAGPALIGFEAGSRRVLTRLMGESFPDYRKAMPSGSTTFVTVETGALLEAVKRVSLVLERNSPLRLAFTDGSAEIVAGAGDEADASETLEIALSGDPVTIAFNPQYLIDGLSAVDAKVTRIAMTEPSRPAVLTGLTSIDSDPADGEHYRYLLMPMRVTG